MYANFLPINAVSGSSFTLIKSSIYLIKISSLFKNYFIIPDDTSLDLSFFTWILLMIIVYYIGKIWWYYLTSLFCDCIAFIWTIKIF